MHAFAEWLLCAGYYCLISWLLRAVLSMYSSGWKTANKEILWGKCCARIMMEGRSRKINEFEMRWGQGCSLRREQWSTRRRGSKSWLRNLGVRERQEPMVFKFPPSQTTGAGICWDGGDNWSSKTTGEKDQKLQFGHVESDMSSRHPSGNAEEKTGYISSKSWKEDRTTTIKVWVISKSI